MNTKFQALTSHPFKPAVKPMPADKWLDLAHAKDDIRPALCYTHTINGKTYSADGFRIHRVNAPVDHELYELPDYADVNPSHYRIPDFAIIFPTHYDARVTVTKLHLQRALTACATFAKECSNITRISVNGSMQLMARSAETGDCKIELADGDTDGCNNRKPVRLTYTHEGADIKTAFNYKFLLDALKGMPETVTLEFQDLSMAPIVVRGIVDGIERTAVIMPMHVEREPEDN